ncbi:MAG: tetratricopeptide repeat protein [Acidobacteriota bacterium]
MIGAAVVLAALMTACSQPETRTGADAVVVYGFTNATGDDAYGLWDAWLVDMVARDLWQADDLNVFSPQRVADLRARLGEVTRAELLAAIQEVGGGIAVVGRLERKDNLFSIHADVLSTGTGRLLGTADAVADKAAAMPAAADLLRDQVWAVIGTTAPEGVQSVTALTTENVPAYGQFIAGQALYFQQKFLAAVPYFAKAGQADRDFALAHFRRATAVMRYLPVATGEVQAFVTLAWGKRQHATLRDRLAIEGVRALVFSEPDEAAEALGKLRSRWPGDKEAAYFHGLALGQLGHDGEAADAYADAVKFDPDFLPGWEDLASTAFVADQRGRAEKAVEAGLKVDPADPRLLATHVTLLMFSGKLDAAREALDQALEWRQDRGLLLARAQLSLLTGDVEGALEQATEVRSPLLAAAAELYRGTIRAGLSRLASMSDLQAASGNSVPGAVGKWMTGLVLERNGDRATAIDQFMEAANLRLDFLDSREALGVAYAESGNLKNAEAIVKGLRDLGPHLREQGWERHVLRVEGAIALAAERWDEAIERMRRAYELSGVRFLAGGYISDRPVYAEALGRAYLAKGDLDSARPIFADIVRMSGDRLFWPWIWLGAEAHLAEIAARQNRPADAQAAAAVVRRFWKDAAGQNQMLVDGMLKRLDLATPEGN